MRARIWLVAVLVGSLLVASAPWAASAPAEPVRIGIITSLTGRFATFGKMQVAGYKVALEEINGKGGVKKRLLEYTLEDDASAVPGALSAAERLLSKNVAYVLENGRVVLEGTGADLLARPDIKRAYLGV